MFFKIEGTRHQGGSQSAACSEQVFSDAHLSLKCHQPCMNILVPLTTLYNLPNSKPEAAPTAGSADSHLPVRNAHLTQVVSRKLRRMFKQNLQRNFVPWIVPLISGTELIRKAGWSFRATGLHATYRECPSLWKWSRRVENVEFQRTETAPFQTRHWNTSTKNLPDCLFTVECSIKLDYRAEQLSRSILLRNAVQRNEALALFTVFGNSLNSMFSAYKGKNSSDSYHHRIPIIIMA